MTKYILVGGYVWKAEDGGKAFVQELVKGFDKPVKILDCLFASAPHEVENKFKEDRELFSKFDPDVKLELAIPEKFLEQLKSANVLFLKGGDTEQLMQALKKCGDWLAYLDGKTVAGTSAGAMALVKYSHALEKDKLIEGFGIVPLKIIAHWESQIYDVSWGKVLMELASHGEDLPIHTLREGEFIVIEK